MMGINKLYIIAVSLVAAVILGIVLVLPKYQDLREVRSDIGERELELQSKIDYYARLKEISRKLADYEESFSKISGALPAEPSFPSLFDFFQKTSSQNGLLLEDIKLGAVAPLDKDAKVKEIGLSVTLSGAYPDLKNFLLAVENSARLIEVNKISFSAPAKGGELFSFRVDLKTHSY